jgi:hypothetical protein
MLLALMVTTSSSMLLALSASIRISFASLLSKAGDRVLRTLDLWLVVQYFDVIGCSSIKSLKIFDEEFDERCSTGKHRKENFTLERLSVNFKQGAEKSIFKRRVNKR